MIDAIKNTIYFGDSEKVLKDLDQSVQLVVTSPPYFNMRGEMKYDGYKDFLRKMYRVFKQVYRVLDHHRMCVVNSSDYREDGIKYPVPYDLYGVLRKIGFRFQDDIIWAKPKGIGSAKLAGIFIQHQYPMYYRPDMRYEHIMVFSKGGGRPYDHVRKEESKIDVMKYKDFFSDVWEFSPQRRNERGLEVHNSAYPIILPEMITRFYSYKYETVLDPFFGHGTTMRATTRLSRSCIGIELYKQRERAIKKNVRYGQSSLHNNINWNIITHPSANTNPIPTRGD